MSDSENWDILVCRIKCLRPDIDAAIIKENAMRIALHQPVTMATVLNHFIKRGEEGKNMPWEPYVG